MGLFDRILDEAENIGRGAAGVGLRGLDAVTPDSWEDPAMATLQTVGNVLDVPRQAMTSAIGTGEYWQSQLARRTGIGDQDEAERTILAYRNGGGRGVWENEMIAEVENPLLRGVIDTAIDPLTYAGAGLINRAGDAMVAGGQAAKLTAPVRGSIMTGVGRGVQGAGHILGSPDKYVFDPVIGKMVGKPLGFASSKVINAPLMQRLAAPAKVKLKSLVELAPESAMRENINRNQDAVDQLLVGKRNVNQPTLSQPQPFIGPMNSGQPSNQSVFAADRAELRAREIRNQSTTNPVVRSILDRPKDPGAKGIVNRAIQSLMSRGEQPMGIVNGITPASSPMTRMVDTDMGAHQVWNSVEDRERATTYLADLLIRNAPTDGQWRNVAESLNNLFTIREEFMTKHDLTIESFADVYRAAKARVEKDLNIRLPDEMYAGRTPGGGGYNKINPNDSGIGNRAEGADVDNFAANTAAGLHTANYRINREVEANFERDNPLFQAQVDELADVIEHKGVAFEFTAEGNFHHENSFKSLEASEMMGRSGFRLMSREEAYDLFQREFGSLPIPVMDELYNEGAERFRQEMVRAVSPSTETKGLGNPLAKSYKAKGNVTDERLLDNTPEKKGVKYTKNRRLLMGKEQADRIIEKGFEGKDFYGDGIREMRSKVDSDEDFAALIDLWVVTSSHTALDANVSKALSAFREWKMNGPAALQELGYDPDFIERFAARHQNSPSGMTLQEGEPTHRAAINNIMSGGEIDTQKLHSYHSNFIDEVNINRNALAYEVDVDGWNIPPEEKAILKAETQKSVERQAGAVTDDMWHQVANGLPTGPSAQQFQILEAASRFYAKQLGMRPHQVQAAVWAGIKGDFGNPLGETGSDFSPAWLIMQKLFGEGTANTKPFVRYTDEYGQKLHPTNENLREYTYEVKNSSTKKMEERTGQRVDFENLTDFVVRSQARAITQVFDRAADTIADLFDISARQDTPIMLQFDDNAPGFLKGVDPDGKVHTARTPVEPGKRVARSSSLRDLAKDDKYVSEAFKNKGATVMDIRIPADSLDKMAVQLFEAKLGVDPLLDKDWSRFRWVLDATENGRDASVKLMWFPNAVDPRKNILSQQLGEDLIAGFPARRQRYFESKGLTSGQLTPDLEYQFTSEFMDDMIKADQIIQSFQSATKAVGNEKPLGDLIRKQLDEEILPNWQESPVYSMDLDPIQGLVESPPAARFSVAIASPGSGGTIDYSATSDVRAKKAKINKKTGEVVSPEIEARESTGKQIAAFIRKTMPLKVGSNGDRLKYGFFQDAETGAGSFDFNFFTDNPVLAREIGEIANQYSIYDNETGDMIEDFGGLHNSDSPFKEPEDMQRFLEAIEEAEISGESLRAIWDRKVFDGDDAANTGIIAGQGSPLSRQKGESRLEYMRRMLSNSATGGQQVAAELSRTFDALTQPRPEDVLRGEDAYKQAAQLNMQELQMSGSPGYSWLDQETNDRLFNTTFDDGESIGDYAERMHTKIEQDRDTLERMGITWEPGATLATKKGLTTDKYVQGIIKEWHDLGLSMQNTEDTISATRRLVSNKMIAESGIKETRSSMYQKAKSIWAEIALASPRYVTANIMTNVMDATITGHFNYGTLMDVFRIAAKELDGQHINRFTEGMKAHEVLAHKYGLESDWSVTNNTAKRMTDTNAKRSQVRQALERVGLGKAAILVEAPRALAQGADVMSRSGIFIDQLDSTFEAGRAELLGKLEAVARNAGVDMNGKELLPVYDPAKIRKYYKDNGFSNGYADRAAREVAELRNKAIKSASKEVNRIGLSYSKTNLDEMVGKVVPFHYWASRKVRFYAEEAYRNPAIAAAYARAIEGVDRAMDEPGMNARQQGFLRLMSGPAGFSLLMNPDALMGVIKAGGFQDTFTPDGQTEIGAIVQKLKKNGVGLYPWIDGALNMMGMYGDTFEPDMLGIRHRALVGSVVNYMRGEGWLGESNRDPGATPYADLNLEAREKLSGWVSTFTPDWLSQKVTVNAGGSASSTSLDQIIESRIIAENPNLTNEELAFIMNDPESEEYQSAWQDAARAGVIQQSLSFTLPVSFKVEENSRDVRNAQQDMIKAQAEKKDIEPWEITDTHADAEFRAAYVEQTGQEFDASDWQNAALEEDLMRAEPDARMFVLRENEYQAIGGRVGQEVMQTYYGILFGQISPPGYKGNIQTTTPEMREWIAQKWLDNTGSRGIFEQVQSAQQMYKQNNPEFAQFKDWQSQMRELQALYGGSLSEYRRNAARQNPAAAQYFAEQVRFLRDRGVPPEKMEAELDRVTTNSNAWFAINGRAKTIYDPQRGPNEAGLGDPMPNMLPQSASTPYNVNQNANQAPQDAAPVYNWAQAYQQRVG